MQAETSPPSGMQDENLVQSLYMDLLECWNKMDAVNYATLFTGDANVIGFDGSQMNWRQEVYDEISGIFANHTVASYVSIIKEVRPIGSNVFILRAVAGMVPPGQAGPSTSQVLTALSVTVQQNDKLFVL